MELSIRMATLSLMILYAQWICEMISVSFVFYFEANIECSILELFLQRKNGQSSPDGI
jgi:hypothetical protein